MSGVSLVVTGGLRVSSDFAKAIALGADAVAIGTAALMTIGCRQYRMCNTGRCPTGVTSQNPELRARINVEQSTRRLAMFLEVTRKELQIFTRMCGHTGIYELSPEDLLTHDFSVAEATGIHLG